MLAQPKVMNVPVPGASAEPAPVVAPVVTPQTVVQQSNVVPAAVIPGEPVVQVTPPVAPAPVVPTPAPVATPVPEPEVKPEPAAVPLPDNFQDVLARLMQSNTPAPVPVQQDNEELLKTKAQNEDLQKQVEAAQKRIADLEKNSTMSDELRQLKEQKEIDDIMASLLENQEWSSIAPTDAQRLIKPVAAMLSRSRSELSSTFEAQLEALKDNVDSRVNGLQEQQVIERLEQTKKRILKAHPDFEKLKDTERYAEIMLAPVEGYGHIRYYQLVDDAFKNGDADYIIGVLDRVKNKNDINDVATVSSPAVAGAGAPLLADDAADGLLTPQGLAELRYAKQSGRITKEQYSAAYNKHREAKKRLP